MTVQFVHRTTIRSGYLYNSMICISLRLPSCIFVWPYSLYIVRLYGLDICITLWSAFPYDYQAAFLYDCTVYNSVRLFSPPWRNSPSGSRPPHYRGFTITLRHTTLDRTSPVKRPARRRAIYLTIHNTQKRQQSMPESRFKPATPASERPHTHAFRLYMTVRFWILYDRTGRSSVWLWCGFLYDLSVWNS